VSGQGLVTDAIEYKYNNLGLVANKRFIFADLSGHREFNYSYTRSGQVKKLSFVDPVAPHYNFDQEYTYDRLLRLSEIKSGKPGLLQTDVKYTYDALGNLYKKQLGSPSASFNDFVAYSYDIRARLKENLYKNFRYLLDYDSRGNIVKQTWSNNSVDHLSPNNFRRMQYSYSYDGMNRLIYAKLDENNTSNDQFASYPAIFNQNSSAFLPTGVFPNPNSPHPSHLQNDQVHVAQNAEVKEFIGKESVSFLPGFRATAQTMGKVHAYVDLAYLANSNANSLYFAPSKYELTPQNPTAFNTLRHSNIYFYTKNGNISSSYIRNDQEQLSRQLYTYGTSDNKLSSVRFDAGVGTPFSEVNYSHDRNGNMLSDATAGITSIVYNDFDQPVVINKTGNTTIRYRYSTGGQRTVKVLPGGARQYYLDHVVLNEIGRPMRYTLDEGYAELLINNQIEKTIENTDWLGTVRMLRDYSGGIVGYRDHYAYGLSMGGRSLVSSPEANRYQFTGHESDGETGFDYHGARYYSRLLARYMSVDPMATERLWLSPYNYVQNNPLNRIDPSGKLDHVFQQQADGSYRIISKNSSVVDEYRNLDGSRFYYNKETGHVSNMFNLKTGEVVVMQQNETRKFNMIESYKNFKQSYEGKRFVETLDNIKLAGGLILGGPAAATGKGLIGFAARASISGGLDDVSGKMDRSGNTLIQKAFGEEDGNLIKSSLNTIGIFGSYKSIRKGGEPVMLDLGSIYLDFESIKDRQNHE
jgi:RHS repeat-associated protein